MGTRARRRWRGLLAVTILSTWALAMAAAVVVLVARGVDDASKWAGVLGALTALAAFSTPLVERAVRRIGGRQESTPSAEDSAALANAADGLARAVQVQLREEARIRRLQDPWPLPVTWAEADAELADHRSLVFADSDARSGTRAGSLMDAVAYFAGLRHRRMVVIGEPGSGKSVFAMVMALQLIERRPSGDAVPVIFPVGSWDATQTALRDWLCEYLTENYHLGGANEHETRRIARDLVEDRRILPLLDGLDEMPESLRGMAIDEINRSLEADEAMILTCRAKEYRYVVASADVVTFAAVIELQPLEYATIVRYLTETTPGGRRGRRWWPIFATLADDPSGPLATVLRSPLMIAIARTVYGDTPRDPAELLDPRLQDPAVLEDHLLDELIPASYHERSRPRPGAWSATEITAWLRFLARHMAGSGRADIAWWQVDRSIPVPVAEVVDIAVCGVLLGVMFGSIVGLAFAGALLALRFVGPDQATSLEDLLRGRLDGFGRLPLLAIVGAPAGRLPLERRIGVAIGRVSGVLAGAAQIRISLSAGALLPQAVERGVMTGIAVGLAVGFLTVSPRSDPTEVHFDARRGLGVFVRHLVVSLVAGLGIGVAAGALVNSAFGVALAVAVWAGMGLIDGLNIWLDITADVTTALSPRSTCRADRFAATCRAGAIGVTIGTAVLAAVVLGEGWRAGPLATLAMPVLFGVTFAIADPYEGLGASAWGRYMAAMTWLSLRGELPWRFMTFLDDAHEHDVLRRAGAVHQFRHFHLQDRLART